MPLRSDNPDDEISELLDKLYEELIMRRVEYMGLQNKKVKDLDSKLNGILELESNFYSILKSHTAYCRYKKVTGRSNTEHSDNLLSKIREVVSNLGDIVSTVPKQ